MVLLLQHATYVAQLSPLPFQFCVDVVIIVVEGDDVHGGCIEVESVLDGPSTRSFPRQLTILGEWIREPLAQDEIAEAQLALGFIGILNQLHLVNSLQPDMGQLPLQLRVEHHLHGQSLELGIATH